VTETERVKVAESAGQHESTGNVSRELGRGCNRRERVSEEVAAAEEGEGEARIRVRAYARRILCKTGAYVPPAVRVLLIILHTAHASRTPPPLPRCFEGAREER